MTILNNYGVGYFQIYTNVTPPVKILDGDGLNFDLDLFGDKERNIIENEAVDGTLHRKDKGMRLYPKIRIFYPQSDIQTALNSADGTIVRFTPYHDNSAFVFTCFINYSPVQDENSAVLLSYEIELTSVNYVVPTPLTVT